tara:strand:+ start:567 stop:1109 length:543 start_codon:yes stop_codon:yes gene_type:complete
MKDSRKLFILEAHSFACSEWKQKIQTEFPKLFVKQELEVGKWYKETDKNKLLICITDCKNIHGYGFTRTGEFTKDFYREGDAYMFTPATDQEVEQALIKEAKKRGFKKGAYMVQNKEEYPDQQEPILIENNKFEFITGDFCVFGWDIFLNGKWATIIEDKKEMTVCDIEKALGYSVKIVK